MRAHVVRESELEAAVRSGDTAAVRVTLDAAAGSERLEQLVVRFRRGRSLPQAFEGRQALLYVVSGSGTLAVGGEQHRLGPGSGAYLAAGEEATVETDGPEPLVAVVVTAPPPEGAPPRPEPRVVRYDDRPALPASGDREFRYLVHRDTGCPDLTQFVGTIAPGRAPTHSHVYDEVLYVLEGRGRLHVEGRVFPVAAGTCIHLPPLLEHTLENDGDGPMRVLGVFYPSGDPASRAYEASV